jgi:hypothetical protein
MRSRTAMNTIRFFITGTLILCCGLIPACTRKKEWTGPKFSGRLLVLARDFDLHADLIEITPGPNSTHNQTVITVGVFDAVASPDQTQLLFSTRDGVFRRDLSSGVDKQMAPYAGGGNWCLAWSPDGKRFSFRSSESHEQSARANLFVSDLNGKTKLIWESWVGGVSSDCDVHWIAPDRLIFDRFLGAAPQQEKAGEVFLPNTATVATLGDHITFVDTDKRWSVDGVCQFGDFAVVRPQHKDYPVFVAKTLDDLKTVKPSQVCSDCRFVGFAAKSCVPFFVATDSQKSTDLYSLNPTDLKPLKPAHINKVFSSVDETIINSSARLMAIGTGSSLFLVDTQSGDIEPFFPKSFEAMLNKKIISVESVVWFEH